MLETTEGVMNGQSRDTVNKCYRQLKGQSRMDNPETL